MEHFNFEGKVAIVTGGASGIGAATARKLASGGAILSLIDLNGDGLKTVADQCDYLSAKYNNPQPYVFTGDLTDDAVRQKFVEETLEQFGKIDILINNAGIGIMSSILDPSMEAADKLISILFRAPYDMCRLTARHLINTQGCIVNIASVCAHTSGFSNPAYNSSKAALMNLTKTLANDLGPHNVRVNSISPGPIKTNIGSHLPEGFMEAFGRETTLLKRCGQPEEIAHVIAFLASDGNSYMTGSDVVVDGGVMAKSPMSISTYNTSTSSLPSSN